MQSMMTSEAMLDPAVSLGTLRLSVELALAGSDDRQVISTRESFDAHIAGRNLLSAITNTDATKNERQAAVDQLRHLTRQMPDSAELRQLLAEALHDFH
jgi:Flp pilus assembly protein TadD